MFKIITKSIANQMDPGGDLVPVRSVAYHKHFQLLCLVRKKRKTIFHPSPGYKMTQYRLDQVLLPRGDNKSTGSLLPSGHNPMQFTVKKATSDRVDGNFSLAAHPMSLELKGAVSLSKEWSIKLQKNDISVQQLEALANERKMNMDHPYIKQLQKAKQNLYVVRETIETLEDTTYEEFREAEGNLIAQLYAKFSAKGTQKCKWSISIPKGCTLAFRAIQLDITDEPWYLQYFPQERIAKIVSDGSPQGKFRALEAEVKTNCQIFSQLPSGLPPVFLKAFKAVMSDRSLFQELTFQMDEVLDKNGVCELQTESPDLKGLLSSLQCSPEHLLELARATTYTLDALDELSEDQLLLLLESLDEGIVPQQLQLVASILKHTEQGKKILGTEASLLSSTERAGELTMALVQMSGVTLQKDVSTVCTEEAFLSLAALYVSLHVLHLLSNLG